MAQPQTCKGAQGVLCLCRSYAPCISHSCLLLFHVWGCRAQKELLLGTSNCLRLFQLIQICSRCLRQLHWKNKADTCIHTLFLPFAQKHTQAHPKPMPAWPWLPWVISICLLDCSLGEEKGMGLEGGFAAREYNPSASPLQSQLYDCWDH